MFQAFVFVETAVTVRHWFEIGPEDAEHGSRLEIRRRVPHPHRGSESASQVLELDDVLWRADLFDLYGGAPGNFERAHYHPTFDGVEPSDRTWSDQLQVDPFGWAEAQLRDYAALISGCGLELTEPRAEEQDLRTALPDIMAAARRVAGSECTSDGACLAATRDTTEIMDMMGEMFREHLPPERRDPRRAAVA